MGLDYQTFLTSFQLYEWAKVLIKKDLAYVCHQVINKTNLS